MKRIIQVLIGIFIVFPWNSPACAGEEALTGKKIYIGTVLTGNAPYHKPQKRVWKLETGILNPGLKIVYYSYDSESPLFALIKRRDSIYGTDYTKPGKPNYTGSNGFFIRPGFPLPVDILPDVPGVYYTKTTSGKRVFKDKYHLVVESISLDAAKENGYLKFYSDTASLSLYKVCAKDKRWETVSLQIWSYKDDFWVYEKGAGRESWRIRKEIISEFLKE